MNKNLILVAFLAFCATTASAIGIDWVCQPGLYAEIQYLGKNLFKVKTPGKEGKWGIVHADGSMRIEMRYDSITSFREDRALLLDAEGQRLLGLVDPTGKLVRDFSGERIYVSRFPFFKEGRLSFRTADSQMFGYMNNQGVTVIQPQFYLAAPFQDGVAAVQYDGDNYGLINKSGNSAFVSDTRFSFISSPVDGKVVAVQGSRKGADQLCIMYLEGAKLKKEKTLENGINIWPAEDFSTLDCQTGHQYYIDDQWRISGASYENAGLPVVAREPDCVVTESNTILGKAFTRNGVKIMFNGSPVMDYTFPNVETYGETYEEAYAIVRARDNKVGALRLNTHAEIVIKAPQAPVVFYHNEMQEVVLEVALDNIDPSRIKWYWNNQGDLQRSISQQVEGGMWQLRMPYFKSAVEYDKEVSENIDIALTYDGYDWIHQLVNIKSLHRPGYKVTVEGPETINKGNSAKLYVKAAPVKGGSMAKGEITVNGEITESFDNGLALVERPVSVSDGTSQVFVYEVEVKEEGCPVYRHKVTKKVTNPKDVVITKPAPTPKPPKPTPKPKAKDPIKAI